MLCSIVIKRDIAGFFVFVRVSGNRFQNSFENLLCPFWWNSHTNLLTDRFFGSVEDKVIREGLQAGPLPVGKGTGFFPVVDVGAATA